MKLLTLIKYFKKMNENPLIVTWGGGGMQFGAAALFMFNLAWSATMYPCSRPIMIQVDDLSVNIVTKNNDIDSHADFEVSRVACIWGVIAHLP